MDKIIKVEKDEGSLLIVTFLDKKHKRYTAHMTALHYKIHLCKQSLKSEGCHTNTLELFEELIREDVEEQRDTERCYERLR